MANYRRRHVMMWQGVLCDMKRVGGVAIFTCPSCGTWGDVDLDVMIRILGHDGSLWDRMPPCENDACDRLAHFMAAPGKNTPMRPMLSLILNRDALPAEAWMGGWTGME